MLQTRWLFCNLDGGLSCPRHFLLAQWIQEMNLEPFPLRYPLRKYTEVKKITC